MTPNIKTATAEQIIEHCKESAKTEYPDDPIMRYADNCGALQAYIEALVKLRDAK